MPEPTVIQPPDYCEYAAERCDQDFSAIKQSKALFLYASDPARGTQLYARTFTVPSLANPCK
jgi:hypothetical protein